MGSLTLYVDKWYIIGAVCTDGVPRIIQIPNREDRFWLYFYEDTANNLIVYGKDNQSHFRDKENAAPAAKCRQTPLRGQTPPPR